MNEDQLETYYQEPEYELQSQTEQVLPDYSEDQEKVINPIPETAEQIALEILESIIAKIDDGISPVNQEEIQEEQKQNTLDPVQAMQIDYGFLQVYNNMSEIHQKLKNLVDTFKGGQENGTSKILEENLELMSEKLQEMKEASRLHDSQRVFQLIEEIKEIVVESSTPLQVLQAGIIDDLASGLQQELDSNERKQPRRRRGIPLIKSKQAISQFKKAIVYILIAIHYFLKNPENIAKCFVVIISCFFMVSYLSIPDMGNRHPLYLFDWLAYNRSSRGVLASGSLCLISFEWYILYFIWMFTCGLNTDGENSKFKTLLNDCNPLLQLALVFMTDNDLINNKFDLAVWFCNLFFYSSIRVYFLNSQSMVKKIISNLSPEKVELKQQAYGISRFATVIIIINAIYTITGLIVFRKVGIYALGLLFYGGISSMIEYVKIKLMAKSLLNNYEYYINNNIDQLSEPFFFQEIGIDSLYNGLRVLYCIQLIANYFRTVSLQFVLHLWLFYLLSDLQSSVSALKRNYYLFKTQRKIQNNLDRLLPRTDPSQLMFDEICSICHDELLSSRTLACGHKFHLKCLFNWLKNQHQCPMCRQQIENVDHAGTIPKNIQDDQPVSLVGRVLQMLTNITLFNITIYFQPGRNNEPPNIQVEELPNNPNDINDAASVVRDSTDEDSQGSQFQQDEEQIEEAKSEEDPIEEHTQTNIDFQEDQFEANIQNTNE